MSGLFATARAEDRLEADLRAKATFLEYVLLRRRKRDARLSGRVRASREARRNHPLERSRRGAQASQAVVSDLAFDKLHRDFGFNQQRERVVGLYETRFSNIPVRALACAFCHSGKAAGIFIPGLGNKEVSNSLIGKGATGFTGFVSTEALALGSRRFDPEAKAVLEINAERMKKITLDPSFVSPTVGLIEDNVVYKTFYQAFGIEYPSGVKGYVNKVPHLWGMSEKRRVGLFCDGAGDGTAPGWTVAVEIMNGQIEETIRKPGYLAKVAQIEAALDDFLPPRYPFTIQPAARDRGAAMLENRCSGCHGTYETDAQGLPIYTAPKLIPLDQVKTDPTRAEFFRDPAFWSAISASRYADLLRMGPNFRIGERRYFAPRLDGVWARFPYLHNGAVPTLWAMLNPSERPEIFFAQRRGRGLSLRLPKEWPDGSWRPSGAREHHDRGSPGCPGRLLDPA